MIKDKYRLVRSMLRRRDEAVLIPASEKYLQRILHVFNQIARSLVSSKEAMGYKLEI